MRLKQLKLSGFKSFVDTTIVPFPSALVAVVGPNGCGKSNIIDAVRWVMGESSAKILRGESMTDVIFMGSSVRKSVGRASVELLFDNSLGRFLGPYANYQEVAVQRDVTRDGESRYFLNGTRCRRRDITDLFLGTGAGARGYAIIGQNTISQIVEARPEDLRLYFEEAAGVSKYKERRRETLQRIQQTHENLSRVQDIQSTMASQLQRLEHQAAAAARYKQLKEEERQCRGDILVLKWRDIQHTIQQEKCVQNQLQLQYEATYSTLTQDIKQVEQLDSQRVANQQSLEEAQRAFYQSEQAVARIHDQQQQQRREQEQVASDEQQITKDLAVAEAQLQKDVVAHAEHALQLQQYTQQVVAYTCELESAKSVLHDVQHQEKQWVEKKDAVNVLHQQAQHQKDVASLNMTHIVQRKLEVQLRLEKVETERQACALDAGAAVVQRLMEEQVVLEEEAQRAIVAHTQCEAQRHMAKEQLQTAEQQVRCAQDHLHLIKSDHAASKAALEAICTARSVNVGLQDYQDAPRLLEVMHIEATWRAVCEWVLGDALHGITLPTMAPLQQKLPTLSKQNVIFLQHHTTTAEPSTRLRLSDVIQGFVPDWSLQLDTIFLAENLADALTCLPSLEKHQSVITSDGVWMGPGWLRSVPMDTQDEQSVLLRKEALQGLQHELAIATAQMHRAQQERETCAVLLAACEKEGQCASEKRFAAQQALQDIKTQLLQKQNALEQAQLHWQRLQATRDESQSLLEDLAIEHLQAEEQCVIASEALFAYEKQSQQLDAEKAEWSEGLYASRARVESIQAVLHQAELQAHKAQIQVDILVDAQQREACRIPVLQERLHALQARAQQLVSSSLDTDAALLQRVEKQHQAEQALQNIRQLFETQEQQYRVLQKSKAHTEALLKKIQNDIVQHQLAEQSCLARSDVIVESLAELAIDPHHRHQAHSEQRSLTVLENRLTDMMDAIHQLGAVNLVAEEEYQAECARKLYLDTQFQDLSEAIATLQQAIHKMDGETEARFKETFEQVDGLFQKLFPRLFGGGHARLALTCDNLLEAGVRVMAQPPGKRNSTIQSLSGGEKAMTAVALLFAIFQRNPSPFCMLDEIDAPLDDLNVGRFCDLVREMSQTVQFLLITHNKVTMELADHLIGVTMREPGVSRIVAVDVEKALLLAESEQ